MTRNYTGKVRKKAPVAPVHPVKAAHDNYMADFAADAANPTPRSRKKRDRSGDLFNILNAENMGAVSPGSGVI